MVYSLLPLDVGFCVRRAGLTVLLPADARAVRYRWWRADRVATGPAESVAAALRRAGYRVRVVLTGPLEFRPE